MWETEKKKPFVHIIVITVKHKYHIIFHMFTMERGEKNN